jgi:hypothetical protein
MFAIATISAPRENPGQRNRRGTVQGMFRESNMDDGLSERNRGWFASSEARSSTRREGGRFFDFAQGHGCDRTGLAGKADRGDRRNCRAAPLSNGRIEDVRGEHGVGLHRRRPGSEQFRRHSLGRAAAICVSRRPGTRRSDFAASGLDQAGRAAGPYRALFAGHPRICGTRGAELGADRLGAHCEEPLRPTVFSGRVHRAAPT